MGNSARARHFERLALPHLDAAYNLARWMTRSEHDAEDVVQEAYLRAYTYLDSYRGENARAWLLAIVRRTCFTWLEANRPRELVLPADDSLPAWPANDGDAPDAELLRDADRRVVNELIAALPAEFREVVVLREIEDCSYREIAEITAIPIGTVMSRLSRARALLQREAQRLQRKDVANGL